MSDAISKGPRRRVLRTVRGSHASTARLVKLKHNGPHVKATHCSECTYEGPGLRKGKCSSCYMKGYNLAKRLRDGYAGVTPRFRYRRPVTQCQPTDARPGTLEKIMILRGRAERFEELFHVLDAW